MDTLFLEDGYTATKTVPAVPGLFPSLTISYRPAVHSERLKFQRLGRQASDEAQAKNTVELIGSHVISINGEPLPKDKISKLKPEVIQILLDQVLGYSPEDERTDLKN